MSIPLTVRVVIKPLQGNTNLHVMSHKGELIEAIIFHDEQSYSLCSV